MPHGTSSMPLNYKMVLQNLAPWSIFLLLLQNVPPPSPATRHGIYTPSGVCSGFGQAFRGPARPAYFKATMLPDFGATARLMRRGAAYMRFPLRLSTSTNAGSFQRDSAGAGHSCHRFRLHDRRASYSSQCLDAPAIWCSVFPQSAPWPLERFV